MTSGDDGLQLAPQISLRQSPRTASRQVEGSSVVVVIDRQELHTLNGAGTFLWESAKEVKTIQELAEDLTRSFDVDLAKATEDTTRFAEQLLHLGALEVVG